MPVFHDDICKDINNGMDKLFMLIIILMIIMNFKTKNSIKPLVIQVEDAKSSAVNDFLDRVDLI